MFFAKLHEFRLSLVFYIQVKFLMKCPLPSIQQLTSICLPKSLLIPLGEGMKPRKIVREDFDQTPDVSTNAVETLSLN